MQHIPSLVPLNFEASHSNVTKKTPDTNISPAGVINFIQTHGRITGNVSVAGKDDSTGTSNRVDSGNATTASVSPTSNVGIGGMPNLASNVFQQRSRNLKNTLNNIKAMRSGQVSLLKSAQNRNPVDDIRPQLVTTTMVPQYGGEPSVEEALPEHMIFAAPKKKREDEELVVQTVPPKLKKTIPSGSKTIPATLDLTSAVDSQASSPTKSMPIVKSLTDAISLGSVKQEHFCGPSQEYSLFKNEEPTHVHPATRHVRSHKLRGAHYLYFYVPSIHCYIQGCLLAF